MALNAPYLVVLQMKFLNKGTTGVNQAKWSLKFDNFWNFSIKQVITVKLTGVTVSITDPL